MPANPIRTGMAIATTITKHLCRVLNAYRPAMTVVINAAVTGGTITPAQAAIVNDWLNSAQGACDILRLITGY